MAWLIDRLPLLSAVQGLRDDLGTGDAAVALDHVGAHLVRLGRDSVYSVDRDDLGRFVRALAAVNRDRPAYLVGLSLVLDLAGVRR